MSIVRTVEWKLRCSAEEADARIREAFTHMELHPQGAPGSIHGAAKRAILKNRWSVEITVEINPTPDGMFDILPAATMVATDQVSTKPSAVPLHPGSRAAFSATPDAKRDSTVPQRHTPQAPTRSTAPRSALAPAPCTGVWTRTKSSENHR